MNLRRTARFAACLLALSLGGCGDGQSDSGHDAGCISTQPAMCAGACVDLTRDASNCGACGHACGAVEACRASACVCAGPLCHGACMDLRSDPLNCGICDRACPAQATCASGNCACPAKFTDCKTHCADTDNDPQNCGACGAACPANITCTNGSCDLPCQGAQLVKGGDYALMGVTADNQAIAYDRGAGALVAFDVRTGAKSIIDPGVATLDLRSNVVFSWSSFNANSPLLAWTAAGGAHPIAKNSRPNGSAASSDGLFIFYSDNAGNGTNADLYVARVDGTGAFRIATGIELGSCPFQGTFVGGRLIARFAPNGANSCNVIAVDPANGIGQVLGTQLADAPFAIDDAGTMVFVADTNLAGKVLSTTGGPAVAIDTDVRDGLLLPGGAAVIYRTSGGALKRAPTAGNAGSITLVASGVTRFVSNSIGASDVSALSPDGRWVIYTSSARDGPCDLYLANTARPGKPMTLAANQTGAIFGDAFTSNSSRVLYYPTVEAIAIGRVTAMIGEFDSQSVAGGDVTPHSLKSYVAWAGQAAKVVFNTNFKAASSSGRADLVWTDTSKNMQPVLIAPQAEAEFYLNRTRDIVVYAVTGTAAKGVYAYTIP